MTSSEMDFCTLCHDDGSSKDAATWCTECEVFLCLNCEKHHQKSGMSEDHKTMSTKDYKKLPKCMQEIRSQCRDHKNKFELYCSFHACPCCVQCVTDKHQKCQDMKPLSDIIKEIKSSASIQLLEKDLKDVKENFEEIIKYLGSGMEASYIQKTNAVEEIRLTRKSIDDFLNTIEQQMLDDLETKHSEIKSKMSILLQQLKRRTNQISLLQTELSEMTRYATELQMYVGLGEIEETTSQAANYIEDLKSGDNFDEKNLDVTISSAISSMLQDVRSFGDVNIKTSPTTLRLKAGRKYQAQYVVHTVPGIQEIKPYKLRTLSFPKDMRYDNILACKILPDGKYLILNIHFDQGHLLLFSKDGLFIRKVVTFIGYPMDACFVRNSTVAVTLGSEYQTALVDIQKNRITKNIKLSHFCAAVASDGNIFVISSSDTSTIVNLNGMTQKILEKTRADRVALYQGNIYGTIYLKNKVCCYKGTGELLWTFKHHDIDVLRGITLDKNGFVYLVSQCNHRILVVTPDGKTCKTVLSDGIIHPCAIDINRETGTMIVSSGLGMYGNSYGSTIVYKLKT